MLKPEKFDEEMISLVTALNSFNILKRLDYSQGYLNLDRGNLSNGYILGEFFNQGGFELIESFQCFFNEFNFAHELEFFQPLYYQNHYPRLWIMLYPCKMHEVKMLDKINHFGCLENDNAELLKQRYSSMKEAWSELEKYLKTLKQYI